MGFGMKPASGPTREQIDADVRSCAACTCRKEADNPVAWEGSRTGVVILGRNPGKQENIQGRPFVGPAGKVLDDFLRVVGLTRAGVTIGNLVSCYTTDDRPPVQTEIATCWRLHARPYLDLLQPYLVITFGAEAARALCGVRKITQAHGEVMWHKKGFWVIPCIHPAAQLHDGRMKHAFAYDTVQVKRFLVNKEEFLTRRTELLAKQASEEQAALSEVC